LDTAVEGRSNFITALAGERILTRFQFAGVSNSSTLYKRGVRVCTGTGLGAALSTCLQVAVHFSTNGYILTFSMSFRILIGMFTKRHQNFLNIGAEYTLLFRYLVWIGSDQEKSFGPTISKFVRKLGPGRVTLWDSKQRGTLPSHLRLKIH
jgi:hypothetical protein